MNELGIVDPTTTEWREEIPVKHCALFAFDSRIKCEHVTKTL